MYLFPYNRETIVLPFTAKEALYLIERVTRPVSRIAEKDNSEILFNGAFFGDSFKISRKVNYPQNYLPLIKGKIETTKLGSIIFLEYELFFSSRMFLGLWTVLSILIAIFLIAYPKEYQYAMISLCMGVLNYVVSLMNFNKQVKESRDVLYNVLKLA